MKFDISPSDVIALFIMFVLFAALYAIVGDLP